LRQNASPSDAKSIAFDVQLIEYSTQVRLPLLSASASGLVIAASPTDIELRKPWPT
jgi:hypothetical protein